MSRGKCINRVFFQRSKYTHTNVTSSNLILLMKTKSYLKSVLGIIVLLFVWLNIQAHGLDSKVTYKDRGKDLTCYVYQKYIVHVFGESDYDTPIKINVFKRLSKVSTMAAEEKNKGAICFESNKQVMSIKPKWPHHYFDGIKNEYLFLDSGTSTIRTLSIYNLKSKKKLHDLELRDYAVLNNRLFYFKFANHLNKGDTLYSKCFKEIKIPYGLALEKLVVFDLKNNVERQTSERQCAYYE